LETLWGKIKERDQAVLGKHIIVKSMANIDCAPVLLVVFNRPEFTRKVIDRLREIKPKIILVAADGPRLSNPSDIQNCKEVINVVNRGIDWPATLITNISKTNMGLRHRMASAITWAFTCYDKCIILEDDCIPNKSFFYFCTNLLNIYENTDSIGAITGDNFLNNKIAIEDSFYFSRYPQCWGWATWKRAWAYYDDAMLEWPAERNSGFLRKIFDHPLEIKYWEDIFDKVYEQKIESWAYRWFYSFWKKDFLCVTPRKNLITNVGVGVSATNTVVFEAGRHFLDSDDISFPLAKPQHVKQNIIADNYTQQYSIGRAKDKSIKARIKRLIIKIAHPFSWKKIIYTKKL